jgi:hypothetical protein
MSSTMIPQPTTSLQWVPKGENLFHLVLVDLCPACQEPASDLQDGICLGCRLDWDNHTIEEYEREEQDYWAEACGID